MMLGILNKLGFNTRAWIAAWMASAKPWCNCCGGRSARDYCHVRPVVGAELSRGGQMQRQCRRSGLAEAAAGG